MITYCIPSKNNLRYLKTAIKSIRENSYYKKNQILVYVDKDDDKTSEWLRSENISFVLNNEEECKGIGYAYDKLFGIAQYDLVIAFHADMILGKNGDLNLLKHHNRGTVVCSTRIEPPLHPPGPEKIIKDFGMWPEDIKWNEFDLFVDKCLIEYKDKITGGLFAPWLIDRRDHLGHDPIFLSVYEDADLFRRFVLANYKIIQSWDSLVYHLTCRGGQFLGATTMADFNKKDELWLKNNQISLLEYIRKWGGMFKENGPCEPKPNTKYDIGLKCINSSQRNFFLEPFVSNISLDVNDTNEYIKNNQKISKFDIESKFVNDLNNDIIIEADMNKISYDSLFTIISNLEDILIQAEPSSVYEIDSAIIRIKSKKVLNPKLKYDFFYNT